LGVSIGLEEHREREPAGGQLYAALAALSAACVALLVYVLPPTRAGFHSAILPALNAGLNSAAGLCLLLGYRFIRRRQLVAHRQTMLFAFGLSALFLVFYLVHHAQVGSVPYAGPEAWRSVYYAILLPHVVLAAAVVPLALITIRRGLKDLRPKHRRLARITLPIWLFVSLSGVVVYWMVYRL
jgi:uncharacterized membrane protein YozB (DUF420 family)